MAKKPDKTKAPVAETGPKIVADPQKPTVEELTKLVEKINDRLFQGAGQVILLAAAFQEGIEPNDFATVEIAARDVLHEGAEAMREALALTYQVEW